MTVDLCGERDAGSEPIVSQSGSCRLYWLVGGLVKNCMRRLEVMLDRSLRTVGLVVVLPDTCPLFVVSAVMGVILPID